MSENSVFVGLSAVLLFLNRQIFWSNFGGFFIGIPNLEKLTVRGILGLVTKKM